MKIIDLTEEHLPAFTHCLEEWSDEMKESGDHKRCWYENMKDRGLGVKLALDESGQVGGMIQFVPAEFSLAEGTDFFFILCIWVHGHKQGLGNLQKKGMGKALLEAAEMDARSRGAKGIAAWGLTIPIWMKAAWFRKQGYQMVDRSGMRALMWKPFDAEAPLPKWILKKKKPVRQEGKVTVTALLNGWCCSQNICYERAKKAVSEFDDRVVMQTIDTFNRDTFLEWGICDALYVDDKLLTKGPPLSYKKIVKKISKKVKRLK